MGSPLCHLRLHPKPQTISAMLMHQHVRTVANQPLIHPFVPSRIPQHSLVKCLKYISSFILLLISVNFFNQMYFIRGLMVGFTWFACWIRTCYFVLLNTCFLLWCLKIFYNQWHIFHYFFSTGHGRNLYQTCIRFLQDP